MLCWCESVGETIIYIESWWKIIISKNDYKVETISTTRDFKAQFSKVFICSIAIMLTDKVILLFENFNPLIKYGDIIYHFIASILSVVTQLAASVASAIIFYYCIEFVNKKRDMQRYIDIRTTLLLFIYYHMESFARLRDLKV